MIRNFVVFFIMPLLLSCSKTQDKKVQQSQIEEKNKQPITEIKKFGRVWLYDRVKSNVDDESMDLCRCFHLDLIEFAYAVQMGNGSICFYTIEYNHTYDVGTEIVGDSVKFLRVINRLQDIPGYFDKEKYRIEFDKDSSEIIIEGRKLKEVEIPFSGIYDPCDDLVVPNKIRFY